jgi:RND family efflux transporter MFP subunit
MGVKRMPAGADEFSEERTILTSVPIAPSAGPPGPAWSPQATAVGTPSPAWPVQADLSDARLAALRSLSLDKDGRGQPVAAHPSAPARASRWPWVLLVIVILAAVGDHFRDEIRDRVFGKSNSAETSPAAGAAATIVVTPTQTGSSALHAAGYMAARTPIVVGSVVPGRVKAMLAAEGDFVKKNQVIAQLDDGQAQAEAALAYARLRDAQRQLTRTKMLRKVEGATAADLDRAVGAVDIARAALAPIQQQIDDAKIRSPIDGTILEELVHQGAIIVGNAGVFRIADLTRLAAEIDVNEADLSLVRVGQKVDVTSDAFADKTFPGTVHEIGEQADRSKGTVTVKVYLEVPENTLRPGISVKATFEADDTKPRLLIPKSAVDATGNVGVIGADGKVTSKHVSVQGAGPDKVEVLDGLAAGDRIVDRNIAHP